MQSRYIEGVIDGILIGCLYLPNGNPAPGPKFDYKLAWFKRLLKYSKELLALEIPVVLAGDFNVMPTDLDAYKPERWLDDALFRSEVKEAYRKLMAQGWTDALRHMHPNEQIYTFWDYFRNAWGRNAGLRIDHMLLNSHSLPITSAKQMSIGRFAAGKKRAIMLRSGLKFSPGLALKIYDQVRKARCRAGLATALFVTETQ